jgi:hypothetical protein
MCVNSDDRAWMSSDVGEGSHELWREGGMSLRRGALLAVVVFAISPGLAAGATRHAPNHKISHSQSTNWSGYAVSGHGTYTTVSSAWTQPTVNCLQTPTGYSSFWVGLDGDTTKTVEQTGWYEMYPKFPVNYSNPVAPGDSMSATVTSDAAGSFQLTLTDRTKGWTQSTSARLKSAKLGSAEVIAEAPSSSGGVLPLADFKQVGFSSASVNGSVLTSSTPGIDPITMATSSGTVKAKPSTISSGSFTDTWFSQ